MATIAQPGAMVQPVTKPATGLWSWITTIDHKRIGVLYGATAFFFLLVGGIEALLIRAQLARPDGDLLSANRYNEMFTMHGTTMIFLAVMPMSSAFFNFVVPLQIGARDVAFPRLNAFSYWVFLFGGIILNLSWFVNEAPNQGWYGYAPITELAWNPGRNVDFWMLGLQILGVASMAAVVQLHRHHLQHARPRYDDDAAAHLHLGHLDRFDPDRPRLPGHHRLADPPDVRPLHRHRLLCLRRRR